MNDNLQPNQPNSNTNSVNQNANNDPVDQALAYLKDQSNVSSPDNLGQPTQVSMPTGTLL